MIESIYIAAVLGLLAGLVIMWVVSRLRADSHARNVQELQVRQAADTERLRSQESRIDELKSRLVDYEQKLAEAHEISGKDKTRIAELQTSLENEQRQNREKLALLEEAEKKMATAFENLANRIIEEKSRKFTEQNRTNIGEVLTPLKEQLGEFKKKIEDVYDKETRDRQSLFHEIKHLKTLNEQMSQDAVNLTNALKGDSKKRGNWGEVILQRVLEESGLKNGREYETQGSFRDESGKLFYPDVVVHLPDNKDVVIDSKVSLNAYDKYYAAESEDERRQALEEHLNSIRTHVNGLKEKNYDKLLGVNSLDLVLMFVPIEPALMLAFEHDENLFRDAFKHRIYLVSPSTLTMNLQIIHNVWRNEYQNQNAREIAKRAGKLYDKFVGFVDALDKVGDNLDKARTSWEDAHKRLTSGRGNLVKQAEDMRKLGLDTSKRLPGTMVGSTDEEEGEPEQLPDVRER